RPKKYKTQKQWIAGALSREDKYFNLDAVKAVWFLDKKWDVNRSDFLVLLSIARRENRERGEEYEGCWPEVETIAKEVHISRPSVHRSLKRLEKKTLIDIEHGRGVSNTYKLGSWYTPKGREEDCD